MSDSRKPGEERATSVLCGKHYEAGKGAILICARLRGHSGFHHASPAGEAVAEPSREQRRKFDAEEQANARRIAEECENVLGYAVTGTPWFTLCHALVARVQALEQEIAEKDRNAANGDKAFDIIDKLARDQEARAQAAEARVAALETEVDVAEKEYTVTSLRAFKAEKAASDLRVQLQESKQNARELRVALRRHCIHGMYVGDVALLSSGEHDPEAR